MYANPNNIYNEICVHVELIFKLVSGDFHYILEIFCLVGMYLILLWVLIYRIFSGAYPFSN